MTLDVPTPHPPDLTTRVSDEAPQGSPGLERRADLEAMLHDNAWQGAFAEWSSHTDLTPEEWAIVEDLDLLEKFDFWLDPPEAQVRYSSPELPEDWRERDLHPDLADWAIVSAINGALDDLGRTVADLLETEYVSFEEPLEE